MISHGTLPYEALPLAASMDRTKKKIEEIRELPPGWRYGQGVKFDERVIKAALELNETAKELLLFETDVFPSENGGLLLAIYYDDYHLELMIDQNVLIDISVNRDDHEIEEVEGQTLEQVKNAIKKFRKLVWKQLDSFTREITIGDWDDSKVRLLPIQVMVPEYLYLTKSAQLEVVEASVTTSSGITLPLLQVPSSIGVLISPYSLTVAS